MDGPHDPARPAPQIIRVPPADLPPWPLLAASAICGGPFVFVGLWMLSGLGTMSPSGGSKTALALGIAGVVFGALVGLLFWRHRRRHNRWRQVMLTELPAGEPDPVVAALATECRNWAEGVSVKRIQKILDRVASEGADRARIVCLGFTRPPAPAADYRFEPMVISPARSVRDVIGTLFGCVALLALAGAMYAGAKLTGDEGGVRGAVMLLAFCALPMPIFVWYWLFRPVYVRLAPGVVQYLAYRLTKDRPRVLSFPMEVGTLVVVTSLYNPERACIRFRFLRGGQERGLTIRGGERFAEQRERAWQALLSTAPTPPLSEDALVG